MLTSKLKILPKIFLGGSTAFALSKKPSALVDGVVTYFYRRTLRIRRIA